MRIYEKCLQEELQKMLCLSEVKVSNVKNYKMKIGRFFSCKVFFVLASALFVGCATSPSGRKQLIVMPDSQMQQMGSQSYDALKKQTPVFPQSSREYKWVQCIATQTLKANGKDPKEWEVQVFRDESLNAFALPGKKIGVHAGMVQFVENSSQLAAVMGHEVAHVDAEHGNERVSQQLVAQLGLSAAEIALGRDSKTDSLILAGLGVGAQFGVLMPFSRAHEKEADLIGLDYMQKAGFDASQAVQLWRRMAEQGGSQPELLSTHPNSLSRAEYLQKKLNGYQAPQHPPCPKNF